jgi:GT2 family glycosyltransferase
MAKIAALIISYNDDLNTITKLFRSLAGSLSVDLDVFVIDNASNASIKELVKTFDGFHYVNAGKNLGFAGGVNLGFSKCNDADYYLILNGDIYFDEHVLGKIQMDMDKRKFISVAGVKMLYPDGRLQISNRRFPKFSDQFLIMTKLAKIFKFKAIDRYLMSDLDADHEAKVDSIMGAFMFIRGSVMRELGGFDSNYFLWYEEVDFCKSVYEAGGEILYLPQFTVYHSKGATFDNVLTWRKQKWMRQSLRRYVSKWFPFHQVLLWIILQPLFFMAAVPSALIKRK